MISKIRSRQELVSSLIKPASQLRGLTFGNKIDKLLQGGLIPKTLTFLYGPNANSMLNLLCSNAVRIYGGKALFIDAANSFDPYFIVQRSNNSSTKSERSAKDMIESIIVSRAFTCYQLRRLVTSKITEVISKTRKKEERDDQQIKSVFVSGIGSLFTREDNSPDEIARIELLMALALRRIASDKDNSVLFVVASSDTNSPGFILKSDTAIKLFQDYEKKNIAKKKEIVEKAILMKHYSRKFETITL